MCSNGPRLNPSGGSGISQLVRSRNVGDHDVDETEFGVVADAEHAVGSQREVAVDAQVGGHLRCSAPVAEHLDVDGHRAGRHRSEEDGVGGHERELGPSERLLHRAQRRVHRDPAEDVHDLPVGGDLGVKAAVNIRVGRECRVGAEVSRAFGHRVSLGSTHGKARSEFPQ